MTIEKNTVPLDDLRLAQCAQKDQIVMKSLLVRLYPRIYKVAWSIAKTTDQAEDVEQAAMEEILKCIGRYRGDGSLESWAGEVTYRTGIKLLKRSWRWERRHVPLTRAHELQTEGPERRVTRERLHKELSRKMSHIPEEQRTAFLLHIIYEHTVNEVSNIMKTSSNTTKYRLKAAVKEMRVIFDENPELREMFSEVKR